MIHFCSLKPTHTKNTICPGQGQAERQHHASLSRNPFIFPEPVVFACGSSGKGVLLLSGKSATASTWW
jgi:hypothetical protein